MIEHRYTENMVINFSKLEKRILQILDPNKGKYSNIKKLVSKLTINQNPTLIIATGSSKVVAYYLKLILEYSNSKIHCEIIEPRDYFHKHNIESYCNLVVISASGKTNGIDIALNSFNGNKYLVCEKEKEADYEVIAWGNKLYDKEKSFISLADSIGPISLLLASTISNENLNSREIQNIIHKIRELFVKSKNKVAGITTNFQHTSLIQILSGYETMASASVLESNLIEAGLAFIVNHDKGSFCHGRSNLLFNYPNSNIIFLSHNFQTLDKVLLELINSEYPNLSTFSSEDIDGNIFWQEYYLVLQMYFLSQKIADDKGSDLTSPEYNPKLVRTLYNYKGEM